MGGHDWVETVEMAVTVCDAAGIIVAMNERSARAFANSGGKALIGTNVLDCHPEPARAKLAALLREGRADTYTIEKRGRRWLVHQAPWFRDGVFAGLVEVSVPLPEQVPHFVRDAAG
jgi:transcriptional regulator with PAS, ATPase and Fis domain